MPAQSTLSEGDRSNVRSVLSPSSYKVLYATLARVYFAYPDPKRWSYGGLQGALAFVNNTKANTFEFRLVDLDGTKGVIWEHELWEGFEYFQDRPFFHSFAGDVSSNQVLFYCTRKTESIIGVHDRLRLC